MKKTTKNIVIAIVITIILFALICVVYQQFRKQPIEQDKLGVGEVLPDANNGLDDMLDNILDSNIESNEEKIMILRIIVLQQQAKKQLQTKMQ